MKSQHELIEWLKGSRLRPYLNVLKSAQQAGFLEEIYNQAKVEYTAQINGEVIFQFRRFFFAHKRTQ